MEKIDISVIITTRDEERHIGNCLGSIMNQTYPLDKREIIVVDNNSNDATVEIAKRFTYKIYNFGPERSNQRNFGVEKALGRYCLFLDADMILSENVLAECIVKAKEGMIALYIPEKVIGKGFWVKVRDFERSFYNGTCIDVVRFVRRDKFLEIGGFDESLTGPEDWDFDRRIRRVGNVGMINSPIYHNEEEFSLKRYIYKKSYYAKSFDKYIRKWGRDDPIIKRQLGWRYRSFGVFFEDRKWKRLLSRPSLALGMYLLILLRGYI